MSDKSWPSFSEMVKQEKQAWTNIFQGKDGLVGGIEAGLFSAAYPVLWADVAMWNKILGGPPGSVGSSSEQQSTGSLDFGEHPIKSFDK